MNDSRDPQNPSQSSRSPQWGPLRPLAPGDFQASAATDADYARPQQSVRPRRKSSLGQLGVIGAVLLFVVGKAKWLFAALKFLKFGSLLSMLGTVVVYSMFFGWPFAVGFVALIFIHEMGHALALKQQGIPSGAPVFIPFVGAFIAMKGRPRNAFVEAIVGIGGPLLGTLGAALCLAAALVTEIDLLYALASVGFLLNLFNMIPISPLDGGRIAGAISRGFWFLGFGIGFFVFLETGSPILGLILLIGGFTAYQRWKNPIPGYYAIPSWKRVAVGAGYFGLLAFMVLGMGFADAQLQDLDTGGLAMKFAAGVPVFGGALFESLRARLDSGGCNPA